MKRIAALLLAVTAALCFLSGGQRVPPAAAPSATACTFLSLCPDCAETMIAVNEQCISKSMDWEFGLCEVCGAVFALPGQHAGAFQLA